MGETNKERWIRNLVIFVAVLSVIFAFQYRHRDRESKEWEAIVIHPSEQKEDPAKIILYRPHKDNHLLITYKIDRLDNNRFTSIAVRQLPEAPEQLERDRENSGIWVKMNENWNFYNERLIKVNRNDRFRGGEPLEKFPFQQINDTVTFAVEGSPVRISVQPEEKVKALYPLATDYSLWLLLLENDVKIMEKR